MVHKNKGASIVMGEAARKFVEVMAGQEVANKVIAEPATTFAAPLFS
jgi:hypothetical protein